jgi:HemY protein
MRRLLLFFSLALLSGAAMVSVISRDSGYVLIALGNTTVEMSVWMATIIFLASLYLIFFAMKIFYGLRYGLENWRLGNQQKLTTRGWLDYAEGEWHRAVNSFLKAAPKAGASFSNYLMAARAANELGDQVRAEDILREAEQQAPKALIAIQLTRAEIQLQNRQWRDCLSTLSFIRSKSPRHRAMLMMLRTIYTELREWENLQALAADLYRAGIIDESQQAALEREAIEHLLINAAEDIGKDAHPLQKLDAAWQHLPKSSQQSASMILQYAKGLGTFGAEARAEEVLRTSIKEQRSSDLIALYGRVRGSDAARQLATAEVWLRELPDNAGLQLALGRLAMRNKQWEKAKHYFENSLRLDENAEGNLELGRLLLALGDVERGKKLLEKGFRANNLLPALPLPI